MLEEALCKVDSSDPAIISGIIDKYSQQPNLKDKSSYLRLEFTLQYLICIVCAGFFNTEENLV